MESGSCSLGGWTKNSLIIGRRELWRNSAAKAAGNKLEIPAYLGLI